MIILGAETIFSPKKIPVPKFLLGSFFWRNSESLIIVSENSGNSFGNIIIAGPGAMQIFLHGKRIPKNIYSNRILWYGTGRIEPEGIIQTGEWWIHWCKNKYQTIKNFVPIRTSINFDTESRMAIYGFIKPGVFHLNLVVDDESGVISKLADLLGGLDLHIFLHESAVSQNNNNSTIRVVCAASHPIDRQTIVDEVSNKLGTALRSISVEGEGLTNDDLKSTYFHSVFLSYSHEDKEFALSLYKFLTDAGIQCWIDGHALVPGEKLHSAIRNGIQEQDKFVLICSETSLKSWWVDNELEEAFAKERATREPVLVPLDLDNAIFRSKPINDKQTQILTRSIGDFTNWRTQDKFEKSALKLLEALVA